MSSRKAQSQPLTVGPDEPNARERRLAELFAENCSLAPLERDALAELLYQYRIELRADWVALAKAARA